MRIVFLVLGAVLIAGIASARMIRVPEEFTSVQAAMDAADPGDEIVLATGAYHERLYFHGKNIVLRSEDPTSPTIVQQTIIDGAEVCDTNEYLITFDGTEDETCRIAGLTIQKGQGGILGNGAFTTIEYCIVRNNTVRYRQTGFSTYENPPGAGIRDIDGLIQNNQILDNKSCNDGAGIYGCDGWILNNEFSGNMISDCPDEGHGSCMSHCDGKIEGNLFTENGPGYTLSFCCGHILGNSFIDNDESGIWGSLCTAEQGLIIEGNLFENLLGWAINLGFSPSLPGSSELHEAPIRNNTITDCFYGIMQTNGPIENNLLVWRGEPRDSAVGLYSSYGSIRNVTVFGYERSIGGEFPDIENCIFWGALDDSVLQDEKYAPVVRNSCVEIRPIYGENNILTDPRFVDPENGDFRLRPDSPCIDAGRFQDGLTDDILGNPRPVKAIGWTDRGDGSGFDIGAYEYPEAIVPVDAETAGWMLY